MTLGLIAGRWLRESRPKIPMKKMPIAGVSGIMLGLALHYSQHLPGGKADLDAFLDHLQRRHLLLVPGRVQLCD